jgi:hypothetical protein
MALDFQQVYEKIKEIGRGARERRERLENARNEARVRLDRYANDLDFLRDQVGRARDKDPNLRCALPVDEALDSRHPLPAPVMDATLIAADGSQIAPDRHGSIQYCLVNVGAIVLELNSGKAPEISTETELLYGDELETRVGPMTDAMVALRRDLKERAKLEELAKQARGPVVTFTDGPVELWGARDGEDAQAFSEALKSYLSVLSRLQSRGVVTAGYVDKPAADLVVRLLEIAGMPDEELDTLRERHPLRGASDRWLYGEAQSPLLAPGERSAVFALQSKSEKDYRGQLALHFFYLNAGTQGHPWPVRVEVPQWVAADGEKLDQLHAVLVSQCRMMGAKPYPYLLHRAHETAVVSRDERTQVEQMLALELRRQDEEPGEGSYKQSAKDLPGKSRR